MVTLSPSSALQECITWIWAEGILRRTAIIPSLGAPAKAFFGFYGGSLLNIWRSGKSQIIKYRHVLREYFHLGSIQGSPQHSRRTQRHKKFTQIVSVRPQTAFVLSMLAFHIQVSLFLYYIKYNVYSLSLETTFYSNLFLFKFFVYQ